MGTGALIRGGVGMEIALKDVLPPNLQNFSTRAKSEPVARAYEAANPGAVVVCDWEVISDADINNMPTEQERSRALADRLHLKQRRETAKKMAKPAVPKLGGDPVRMAEQLARIRFDMSNLQPTHPNYENLFVDWANQINLHEDALGQPRTVFKIGYRTPKEGLSEDRKKELKAEVEKYLGLDVKARHVAIVAVVDPVLAQFMLDSETDKDLREALVGKLAQMKVDG